MEILGLFFVIRAAVGIAMIVIEYKALKKWTNKASLAEDDRQLLSSKQTVVLAIMLALIVLYACFLAISFSDDNTNLLQTVVYAALITVRPPLGIAVPFAVLLLAVNKTALKPKDARDEA